jgi:hypothetical protein
MLTEVPEYNRNRTDTNKIIYIRVHVHNKNVTISRQQSYCKKYLLLLVKYI